MALEIQIATGSSTPIYWQIIDQIGKAVESGAVQSGDQLPSVRALADRLIVNPNTVARAYNDLVRDGVLEAQRGRGVFVAERRQVFSDAERRRRLEQASDVFLHDIRMLGFTAPEIVEYLERRLSEAVPESEQQEDTHE
ncbi:GntR family transcriptional regulator [Capsulimonas corticalis]|uniref:GntR family transcriptional regulator n=1 Tax=Capsulimonas corticalis TaxID=2219043 RepID=A0A402CQZ1_9BACT|nr:GntR family transcriptional regulator [Capsulimonas corticalis]BDI34468.1 GntR family transcriptional regulator [Capsulimonas corticalis]